MCAEWYFYPQRFIEWALENGWGEGLEIDRINNDGNYYPENCRFVTRQENACNQRLLQAHNTSGFRGISWDKRKGQWQSQIKVNGKYKFLGLFKSAKLAALRYDVEAFLLDDGRPMNFIERAA